MAPSAADASGDHSPQSLRGGFFPAFTADILFGKHFGFGGSVAWRGKTGVYQQQQYYRPIFYTLDAVYAPPIGSRVAPELKAGFGGLSSRFYQPYYTCGTFTGCSNYTSSNHLLGHVGAGLKLYAFGNFFVRPEADFYFIRNASEFSSGRASRYGVSIGYTLAPSAP